MSMGGGGSSAPPKDPSKTPPDPTIGVHPPSDGRIAGIQRRAPGQDPDNIGLLIEEDRQIVRRPTPSLIG